MMNKKRMPIILLALVLSLTVLAPDFAALAELQASSWAPQQVEASSIAVKAAKKKKKKATPAPADLASEQVGVQLVTAEPEATPAPTAEPTPVPATPAPTAEPTPTPAPAATPVPVESEQTPTPAPEETVLATEEPEEVQVVDKAALPLVVEFRARINGVRTDEIVADPITVKRKGKVNLNAVAPKRQVTYNGKTYFLNTTVWDPESAKPLASGVTKDLVVYALYDTVRLGNASLGYSANQGEDMVISIPVAYLRDGEAFPSNISNRAATGGQIDIYSDGTLPSAFDQSFVTGTGIGKMSLRLITTDMPFTVASMSAANGSLFNASIVLPFEDMPEGASEGFTEGDVVNKGLATFALSVAAKAKADTYDVPFRVDWVDAEGVHSSLLYVTVKVSKSGGGGGGGSISSGGGIADTTPKQLPQARVYIDNVRTEPENPKAGDSFDIVMTINNTHKSLSLQNMQLSYSVGDDSIMPAGENTNVVYIPKIKADATHEVRIPVVSLPEIPGKLVKMEVTMEFEDSRLNSLSESQTLTVKVQPVQRTKIDDPKPTSNSSPLAGESYELSIDVANTGKTTLYNLFATLVPKEGSPLLAGTPAYGGNVNAGESKKLDLECTPEQAGDFEGTIVISYEDETGEATEMEKPFSFTAIEEDPDMNMWDMEDVDDTPYVPETPSAQSIMAMLPWWLYVALGMLLLLLIVSMSVSARKRRRRAMEDDEVD